MNTQREVFEDRFNAFCKDSDAYLQGSLEGPLRGLKFAAKDIFDVEGHVTGGGNPDWKATHQPAQHTAWAIDVLVKAGATMIGKTHTDELTRGIWGENVHYGTPINPRAKTSTWWFVKWLRGSSGWRYRRFCTRLRQRWFDADTG